MAHYEADAEMQALTDQVEALKDQMNDLAVIRCKAALVKVEKLLGCRVEYWSGAYSSYVSLEKPLTLTVDNSYDKVMEKVHSSDDFLIRRVTKNKDGMRLAKIFEIMDQIFQMDMWLSDEQNAAELGHVTTDEE